MKRLLIGLMLLITVLSYSMPVLAETPTQPSPTTSPSPTVTPMSEPSQAPSQSIGAQVLPNGQKPLENVYIATITDAEPVENYSYNYLSNSQRLSVRIDSGDKKGIQVDTVLIFPNTQFKRPLKRNDQILIGLTGTEVSASSIILVSLYRQNNLAIWTLILIGIFLLISGFRANIKYLQIFLITILSSIIVLVFYHNSSLITLGGIILWQFIASTFIAFRIFRSRIPTFVLSGMVLLNQFIVLGIVYIMKSINLFDNGFFDIFINSGYDARNLMIYVLPLLIINPIALGLAEFVVGESIKKKMDDINISRIELIKHVSTSSIRFLNIIFLAFFAMYFAIFITVLAIPSKDEILTEVLNNASLSQFLSIGFIILFDLVIFVPLGALISGLLFGRVESHQLVTDRNLKQLEL